MPALEREEAAESINDNGVRRVVSQLGESQLAPRGLQGVYVMECSVQPILHVGHVECRLLLAEQWRHILWTLPIAGIEILFSIIFLMNLI